MTKNKKFTVLFILYALIFEVSGEDLSGTYYFTQYLVAEEHGEELKAAEGILYISQNKFSANEVLAIKKTLVIKNATEDWLDNYYKDKDVCIARLPKPPSVIPDYIGTVISSGERRENEISILVHKWPDWAYYLKLDLEDQTLKITASGGERAFGYISERFEIVKIRNVGLKTCLSMIEAGNNIWWPNMAKD